MPEDDYLSLVTAYLNTGFRVKHVGPSITDLQTLISGADNRIGQELASYLREVASKLMGQLTTGQAGKRSTMARGKISRAKNIKNIVDFLEPQQWVPRKIIYGLQNFYQSMGIKASAGEVGNILDTFTRVHRSSIFGFHIMRAVRDIVTADFFMLAPRYNMKLFAQAFRDVVIDRAKRSELLERYVADGKLQDDMALHELIETGQGASQMQLGWARMERISTTLYRNADVHQRLMATRLAELATRKAMAAYKRNGDFGEFLELTALDTVDPGVVQNFRTEIATRLRDGDTEGMANFVSRVMQDAAVFNYLRPNAPAFHNYAAGRFFGQYGTWSINAVDQLRWLVASPMKNHGFARGSKRAAAIAARYAATAQAVYTMGAAMNVDTSDWMPWAHNLWYEGGPGLTLLAQVRDIIGGDPVMSRRLEREPGAVLIDMLRRGAPIPFGGDAMRKAFSQVLPIGDELRGYFGMPDMQRHWWDRIFVGAGFHPYSHKLTDYSESLLRQGATMPIRAIQDVGAEAGAPVARATKPRRDKMFPLVGGR